MECFLGHLHIISGAEQVRLAFLQRRQNLIPRNDFFVRATAVQERPMVAKGSKAGKLAELRKLMSTANSGKPIDAYIIPTEDPHMVRHLLGLQSVSLLSNLR